MEYYKKELNKVGVINISIKLVSSKGESKFLSLTKESIKALQDYLEEVDQKLTNKEK